VTTQDYAKGLRAIAAWYEGHPETPLPNTAVGHHLEVFTQVEDLPALIRSLGGIKKEWHDGFVWLTREFEGGLKLKFYVPRDTVCTKRVVRTEYVPERVIPACNREIIEWDCKPILSGDGDA
jgi:hypothetical protein